MNENKRIVRARGFESLLLRTEEDMQRYTYDQLNRLGSSTFGKFVNTTSTFTARTNSDYQEYGSTGSAISYDDNGNILSLYRNGYYYNNTANSQLMDQLSYTMTSNTNKLASISDAITTTVFSDFNTNSSQTAFTYNNLAQLTASQPDGVSAITYYPSGKTKKITYSGTSNTAEYFYTETNQLYKTKYTTNSTGKIKYIWYINLGGQMRANYEYNTADATPTFTLTKVPVYGNGRIAAYDRSLKLIEYELKDHLGNVRATVKYAGLSGVQTIAQVTTWTDYYAFGGPIPGRSYNLGSYRYNCEGQENASSSKWINFDLRMLNYDIGRWMTPDPKGQNYSPFVAMGDNPISNVDPDGGFYTNQIPSASFMYNLRMMEERYATEHAMDYWHEYNALVQKWYNENLGESNAWSYAQEQILWDLAKKYIQLVDASGINAALSQIQKSQMLIGVFGVNDYTDVLQKWGDGDGLIGGDMTIGRGLFHALQSAGADQTFKKDIIIDAKTDKMLHDYSDIIGSDNGVDASNLSIDFQKNPNTDYHKMQIGIFVPNLDLGNELFIPSTCPIISICLIPQTNNSNSFIEEEMGQNIAFKEAHENGEGSPTSHDKNWMDFQNGNSNSVDEQVYQPGQPLNQQNNSTWNQYGPSNYFQYNGGSYSIFTPDWWNIPH